jgi:uncharacterized protein YbbK (DUF523 family)
MNKILVSACLLGDPVRYDGRAKGLDNQLLDSLLRQHRVIRFCPEVAGGLPVPRDAAEIENSDGSAVIEQRARVITHAGEDVSDHFVSGAKQALALCQQHHIRVAVLTESSPSCGSTQIYDGSFSRKTKPGVGVTTALLQRHGIAVFSQHRLEAAIRQLQNQFTAGQF